MRQMYVFLKAGSLYHDFAGNWRPASSKVALPMLNAVVDYAEQQGQ